MLIKYIINEIAVQPCEETHGVSLSVGLDLHILRLSPPKTLNSKQCIRNGFADPNSIFENFKFIFEVLCGVN